MKFGNLEIEKRPFIDWNITSNCNLDCYYCGVHDSKKQFLNRQLIVKWINKNFKNPRISLFGGEPSIVKDIDEIIGSLNGTIDINTNLKKSLPIEALKNKNLNIISSIHLPQLKLSDFINNLYIAKKYNKNDIIVKIMMDSTYDFDYISLYNKLKNDFKVSLDPVFFENQDKIDSLTNYNDSNFTHPKNELIEKCFLDYNPFKGYFCSGGFNSIYIDYNGDVYKCQTYKSNNEKMGNCIMNNIKLKNNKCYFNKCYDWNALKNDENINIKTNSKMYF